MRVPSIRFAHVSRGKSEPLPGIVGVARVDRKTKVLVRRLEPGDIAVIDHPDLDRVSADELIACRVAAVVNAARSVTGRYPNLGPGLLLDAGIPVVDDAGQLVQTQRYLFPAAVLGHAKEIGAGQLQIDLVWFEDGLGEVLKAARKAGGALPEGEAALPVGVVTTYVENGESRTDQSLYRVGYVAESGLLGAVKLRLVGASLVRRGVTGDLQAAVERAWAAEAPGGAAP